MLTSLTRPCEIKKCFDKPHDSMNIKQMLHLESFFVLSDLRCFLVCFCVCVEGYVGGAQQTPSLGLNTCSPLDSSERSSSRSSSFTFKLLRFILTLLTEVGLYVQ